MKLFTFFKKKSDTKAKSKEYDRTSEELNQILSLQDAQIAKIHEAEANYKETKDIDALILFWENIWNNGGLLFNGSKWAFRLPDLYIKCKRYDDALAILYKLRDGKYFEKAEAYIQRIKNPDIKKRAPTKTATNSEPDITKSEKQYYLSDDYYKDVAFAGTQFERRVITFDERKSISFKSSGGLYVAEILLLQYCSYGTYPNPKNGYPGFWWFEYGIRNVDVVLESLESRGYIKYQDQITQLHHLNATKLKDISKLLGINPSGNKEDIISDILANSTDEQLTQIIADRKYTLTDKGRSELEENLYIPYMHKHKKKTIEGTNFGPEFNVWSINRIIGEGDKRNWKIIVDEQERILDNSRR